VISTNQFKVGMTIRFEGDIYRIAEYQHVKPGKGGAFVRTKLRNVSTGSLIDRTFRPEQKFEQLRTESRPMTYLYEEPDQVVFMDAESYEQLALPKSILEGRLDLMTLNMQVDVVYIDSDPFDVELPTFVDLKVTDTAAGVRGDTVSGGSKAATLESGATIQVPLFIEPGDVVRLDTRTREYVTRA
jgi:elongation factor P